MNASNFGVKMSKFKVTMEHRCRRQEGQGERAPPKKKIRKYIIIFWQLLCKIWAFFGRKSCKIREFRQLFGQIYFSDKNHIKFGHFVNSSCIFFGQKYRAAVKLTELLRLCGGIIMLETTLHGGRHTVHNVTPSQFLASYSFSLILEQYQVFSLSLGVNCRDQNIPTLACIYKTGKFNRKTCDYKQVQC